MHAKRMGFLGGCAATGALLLLGGCTSDDWTAIAEGMAIAADEIAVTTAQVPRWGCGYNGNYDLVCDDTGDGFADRYGTVYDTSFVYAAPLTRVNDYGEAYVYDTDCSCWAREPSLDELPDYDRHHRYDDDD